MKTTIFTIIVLLFAKCMFAQKSITDSSKLTFSGYAEIYYGYDFNKPLDNMRPAFVYNYTRNNEVNVNLAYLKAGYTEDRVRANVALMVGTYANANLAAEPGVLKNVLEANIGLKLAPKANLWLDAGVFASHIGFESEVGNDCWTLTRSIVADNSPYYESGAKIGYTTNNGKFFVSALLLNGFQRIERPDGNTGLSGGLQVTWEPNPKVTLNYSNYYGNDKPDSVARERFYNDFYTIIQLNKKFGVTAGVDFASEQKAKGSSACNYLYSPLIIVRYTPVESWAIAARVEYYQDPNGIIIATGTPDGFKTTGYSINADYVHHLKMCWYGLRVNIMTVKMPYLPGTVSLFTATSR